MINIYKNYYIDADSNCFILKKRYVGKKKDSNEEYNTYQNLGYFSSMGGLYSYFIREIERDAVQDETITTIHGFVERMKDVIVELKYFTHRLEDIEALRKSDYSEEE